MKNKSRFQRQMERRRQGMRRTNHMSSPTPIPAPGLTPALDDPNMAGATEVYHYYVSCFYTLTWREGAGFNKAQGHRGTGINIDRPIVDAEQVQAISIALAKQWCAEHAQALKARAIDGETGRPLVLGETPEVRGGVAVLNIILLRVEKAPAMTAEERAVDAAESASMASAPDGPPQVTADTPEKPEEEGGK